MVDMVTMLTDVNGMTITKIDTLFIHDALPFFSYYFGDIKAVTLAGTVYEDKNNNGVLDSGEPEIAGVNLTMTGTDEERTTATATATTSSGGTYSFTNDNSGGLLRPGTYQIAEM